MAAIVAPLAALALIAAASAVSVNPMLLSIATISRNRRHLGEAKENIQVTKSQQRGVRQMRLLERYLSSLKGQHSSVTDKLLVTHLQCSGLVSNDNHCLEQVVCLYTANSSHPTFSNDERDVISM